jgi:hypothetical protein
VGTELLERCADVTVHDDLRWAVPAVEPLSRELWAAFGAMRSVALVASAVAGQLDVGLMLIFVILVSFRIEELVTRRFVLAGGAHGAVLIEAKRRWLRDRPGDIVGRFPHDAIERTTMGMVSDRWQLSDQTLGIGRRHRSTIEDWLADHTEQ